MIPKTRSLARPRFELSLRLRHPRLDPQEISAALRLWPSVAWRRGEAKRTPTGKPLPGVYDASYWSCELARPRSMGLADLLRKSVAELESCADFLKRLRATGGSAGFLIGWLAGSSAGTLLDSLLLSKLAELQLDLFLEPRSPAPGPSPAVASDDA
ncbi:MAG: hypothetical protein HY554_17115 [Elusimicrobia bacterium]|nr:hypothetical protein [Elusimicrobiota bacterium]